jgi:hypothetical protein
MSPLLADHGGCRRLPMLRRGRRRIPNRHFGVETRHVDELRTFLFVLGTGLAIPVLLVFLFSD